MESNQIGNIGMYENIGVECGNESFVLQVLSTEECKFIKYYMDETGRPCQGLLVLDSNEIFNTDPSVIKLTKLDVIPRWMRAIYVDCMDIVTSDCIDVE